MRPAPADARPDHDPDRALLAGIARQDRAAFDAFYRRHHRALFRFLVRVTQDLSRVEEALNDTMLAVWQGAASYAGGSRVSTWLFGIAWRQARRAERRDRPWRDTEDVEALDPADPVAFDAAFEWADLADRVARGLATLPPEQRAVVELTWGQGCDVAEIAEILGCPAGTVKTRMFHARRKLRALLDGPTGGGDGSARA